MPASEQVSSGIRGRTESPTRRYFAVPACQVLMSWSWTPNSDGLATWWEWRTAVFQKQIFCSELAQGTRRQGGQTKRYKDSPKNSLRACDISAKGWEHLAADRSAWGLATHNGAQAFWERGLSQLDIKRQARKEAKARPAAAVACPVCGRICASEFGLRSHQRSHWHRRRFATDNYDDDDDDDDETVHADCGKRVLYDDSVVVKWINFWSVLC